MNFSMLLWRIGGHREVTIHRIFHSGDFQRGERPAITISGENQNQMLGTSSSQFFFKDLISPQPRPPGSEVLVDSIHGGNGAKRTGSMTDELTKWEVRSVELGHVSVT
jgi:hypothetical protein